MGKGKSRNEIKIINLIEIDGKPPVLFDSLSKEEQKRVAIIMSERMMIPLGFKRVSP